MSEAQSPPARSPSLSAEQWQGLARLADLINALRGCEKTSFNRRRVPVFSIG